MIFLIFLLGLAIGSFINAFVYRLQNKEKIVKDRSRCPHCKHTLAWYNLLPLVSYAVLLGKCRYCKKNISWQYPFVEAIAGIVFILPFFVPKFLNISGSQIFNLQFLIYNQFSIFNLQFITYLFFSVILLIIFAYDLKYMLIPDKITIPAIILVILIQTLIFKLQIVNLLFAAAVVSGFFLFQLIISRGTWIGGGDIRLGFLMGLMLGWPKILAAVLGAYILGSAVTLPLVVSKKKSMKSMIPFGTFLSIITIAALVFGDVFIDWYLNLLWRYDFWI